MADDEPVTGTPEAVATRVREAAARALAEAERRRKSEPETAQSREKGGREGPDPVRFGDWETKGLASDF